jgi:hypothetical protein
VNEERVAVINLALEGRLSLDDAARLLEHLAALERGDAAEAVVVEPPCRPPSWMRAGEDSIALLQADRIPAFLSTATAETVRALETGDRSALTRRLSALDLPALGDYGPFSEAPSYASGGMQFKEHDGVLRLYSVNLVTDWIGPGDAEFWMIHWLLLPGQIPTRLPESDVELKADYNGRKRRIMARAAGESVSVSSGIFPDCLEVRYETLPDETGRAEAIPGPAPLALCTMWLARGVGPVKLEGEHGDGTAFRTELTAFTASGEGYFPLSPGSGWRYDTRTPAFRHRELWRTLAPSGDGRVWLSTAGRALPAKGDA